MKNPIRVTVALDEERSQSETVRRALKFYYEFRELERYEWEKIVTYVEMLSEHVILDHWVTFLKFIELHPESERFWDIHREVAKAHAEEFMGKDVRYVLERLEACNFFRINQKDSEFTLILNKEETKMFVRMFLEEVLKGMGYRFEIKEDLMKIRLKL